MAHLHCINFIDREKLLVINVLLKMSLVSKPIFSKITNKGKRILNDAVFIRFFLLVKLLKKQNAMN